MFARIGPAMQLLNQYASRVNNEQVNRVDVKSALTMPVVARPGTFTVLPQDEPLDLSHQPTRKKVVIIACKVLQPGARVVDDSPALPLDLTVVANSTPSDRPPLVAYDIDSDSVSGRPPVGDTSDDGTSPILLVSVPNLYSTTQQRSLSAKCSFRRRPTTVTLR